MNQLLPASVIDGAARAASAYVLDHVAVAVPDLEPAIDWYRDYLGFEVLERRHTCGDTTSMSSAVMKLGTAVIVLVQGHEPDCQINRFLAVHGPGVQHIAVAVPDLDDALRRFPADVAPSDTPVIVGEGIRQVFLRRTEASGVRVELIERSGGEFSDDTVSQLFKAFEHGGFY